jgi:Tfp pilus assembly protein PilZ
LPPRRKLRAFVHRVVKASFTADSEVMVENLSLGGCFVRTDATLSIGQEVSVDFSPAGGARLRLTGRVAWLRPEPPGFGIMFDDPGEGARKELALLIAESEEPGPA